MERNYFEKVHRNEITSKRDDKMTLILKYRKLRSGTKTTTIFCLFQKRQKKYVEIASIIHELKLYQKYTLK